MLELPKVRQRDRPATACASGSQDRLAVLMLNHNLEPIDADLRPMVVRRTAENQGWWLVNHRLIGKDPPVAGTGRPHGIHVLLLGASVWWVCVRCDAVVV